MWTSVQGIYGHHRRCGTYHQRQGRCPAEASDTGPPPESSTLHQRYVVQTAEDHGFIGLGEALAAAARNGNGHHHASEDPP